MRGLSQCLRSNKILKNKLNSKLDSTTIKELENKISAALDEYGYKAIVKLIPSKLSGRYKLNVISQDFEKICDGERKDIVWRIIEKRWDREYQLRITLLSVLTEKESCGEFN